MMRLPVNIFEWVFHFLVLIILLFVTRTSKHRCCCTKLCCSHSLHATMSFSRPYKYFWGVSKNGLWNHISAGTSLEQTFGVTLKVLSLDATFTCEMIPCRQMFTVCDEIAPLKPGKLFAKLSPNSTCLRCHESLKKHKKTTQVLRTTAGKSWMLLEGPIRMQRRRVRRICQTSSIIFATIP